VKKILVKALTRVLAGDVIDFKKFKDAQDFDDDDDEAENAASIFLKDSSSMTSDKAVDFIQEHWMEIWLQTHGDFDLSIGSDKVFNVVDTRNAKIRDGLVKDIVRVFEDDIDKDEMVDYL